MHPLRWERRQKRIDSAVNVLRNGKDEAREITENELRQISLQPSGVEEALFYGAPGFRVRKKLLARIHSVERCVVPRVRDIEQQEASISMDPKALYLTGYHRGNPYALARPSVKGKARVLEVLEAAWLHAAPKKTVASFDGN
jgi:hypothetical protein